jgi:hypothetical protein
MGKVELGIAVREMGAASSAKQGAKDKSGNAAGQDGRHELIPPKRIWHSTPLRPNGAKWRNNVAGTTRNRIAYRGHAHDTLWRDDGMPIAFDDGMTREKP